MLRRHSGSNDEDEASQTISTVTQTEGNDSSSASRISRSEESRESIGPVKSVEPEGNLSINQIHEPQEKVETDTMEQSEWRRRRLRGPWRSSLLVIFTTALSIFLLFSVINSFMTRHRDPVGCEQPWMRPIYGKYKGFDTEHTRFASKYGLYLYREGGMNEDFTV